MEEEESHMDMIEPQVEGDEEVFELDEKVLEENIMQI